MRWVIKLIGESCDWYATNYSNKLATLLGTTKLGEARQFRSYTDASQWAIRYAIGYRYDLVEVSGHVPAWQWDD